MKHNFMGSFKFLSPALIEWYLIFKVRVSGNKLILQFKDVYVSSVDCQS